MEIRIKAIEQVVDDHLATIYAKEQFKDLDAKFDYLIQNYSKLDSAKVNKKLNILRIEGGLLQSYAISDTKMYAGSLQMKTILNEEIANAGDESV